MTNEEAIKEIQNEIEAHNHILDAEMPKKFKEHLERTKEALAMAIEALEQEPCEDCISQQAVINKIANTNFWLSTSNWEELMKAIDDTPSVKPTREKGKWINELKILIPTAHDEFGMAKSVYECIEAECSICGKSASYKPNFCPNCGADMRDEEGYGYKKA